MIHQDLAAAIIGCAAVTFILLMLIGWDHVEVTNWGLKCNSISKHCDTHIYAPGRYLVGPFNSFFNFPGSLQTIEFSNRKTASSAALKTRTAEGLSLGLHVSFQYQIIREEIPQLYAMNALKYESTFIRMARDIILQAAGKFEAPEYWVNRTNISLTMKEQLQEELKRAHAKCIHLQILDIELPSQYEDSIVLTQVEVQKKTMRQFEQKAQMTYNEIQVLFSTNEQQIKAIQAQADADAYMITQQAIAQSNQLLIDAEAHAYKNLQSLNGFNEGEFTEFLYWQSVLKQKNSKLVLKSNAPLTYNLRN